MVAFDFIGQCLSNHIKTFTHETGQSVDELSAQEIVERMLKRCISLCAFSAKNRSSISVRGRTRWIANAVSVVLIAQICTSLTSGKLAR